MCLFRSKKSQGTYTPGVKPVQDTDTSLPAAQEVIKPGETDTQVSYGTKKKNQAAPQNAQSLAINLPNPNAQQTGAATGGINTGAPQP